MIEIDSSYDNIAKVVVELEHFLKETALEKMQRIYLSLAVTEVLNNIVEHGYQNKKGNRIEVSFSLDIEEIRIELVDESPAYAGDHLFTTATLPDPLDFPESGWGFSIIKQSVDDLHYVHHQGQNTITLIKKII